MGIKHQATIPLLTECNLEKLRERRLPECNTDEEIALAMGISVGKLRFLAFKHPTSPIKHYLRFQIRKKTGEERMISAPMPNLKAAQTWILNNILEKLEVHDAAHGFRQSRSIVTNAKLHVGADVILKIDLKNFSQSISYKRVKELFRGFGYSEKAAQIFGLICTAAEMEEIEIDGQINHRAIGNRHLPQGSPASPAISNFICYHLDSHLAILSKKI